MSTPTESARKIMEAMAFCMDAPEELTLEKVDGLIEWALTGKPPANSDNSRGDLLHALYKLRLHMASF